MGLAGKRGTSDRSVLTTLWGEREIIKLLFGCKIHYINRPKWRKLPVAYLELWERERERDTLFTWRLLCFTHTHPERRQERRGRAGSWAFQEVSVLFFPSKSSSSFLSLIYSSFCSSDCTRLFTRAVRSVGGPHFEIRTPQFHRQTDIETKGKREKK